MNVNKDIQKAVEKDTRWDNGKLGEDEAYVKRVSPKEQAALDEAAELKVVELVARL